MTEKTQKIVNEIISVLSDLSIPSRVREERKMQLLNTVDKTEWASAVRALNDWLRTQ